MPTVQPLDSSTHSRPARSARIPRGALRGFDILLIVVLARIGAFVGFQVLSRTLASPRKHIASPVVETPTRAVVQPAGQPAAADSSRLSATTVTGDMAVATVKSSTAAPVRDLSQIKALIAETPGTYMTDMIADLDGHLVRWPDRRQDGLRIWVQSSPTVASWDRAIRADGARCVRRLGPRLRAADSLRLRPGFGDLRHSRPLGRPVSRDVRPARRHDAANDRSIRLARQRGDRRRHPRQHGTNDSAAGARGHRPPRGRPRVGNRPFERPTDQDVPDRDAPRPRVGRPFDAQASVSPPARSRAK